MEAAASIIAILQLSDKIIKHGQGVKGSRLIGPACVSRSAIAATISYNSKIALKMLDKERVGR
jgi:hypothetical protein